MKIMLALGSHGTATHEQTWGRAKTCALDRGARPSRFAAMVRFNLLGELRLEIDGRDVELPASRKARLLLVMLALERRAHGRSELAGRLWPDVREDSARQPP